MRPLLKKKQKTKKNNKTKKQNKKKKWVVFQMTCFLISTSKGHVLIYYFQSFQEKKNKTKKKQKKVGCLPNDLFLDFYISL